MMYFNICPKN